MSTAPRDVERFRTFLRLGLPGPHAYSILLGLESFDLPSIMKAIEKGFPFKAFERLMRNTELSSDRVAEIVGIPRRTLARRKIEKVPSAITHTEFNYMVNPLHPDFELIQIGEPRPLHLDVRLLT